MSPPTKVAHLVADEPTLRPSGAEVERIYGPYQEARGCCAGMGSDLHAVQVYRVAADASARLPTLTHRGFVITTAIMNLNPRTS